MNPWESDNLFLVKILIESMGEGFKVLLVCFVQKRIC